MPGEETSKQITPLDRVFYVQYGADLTAYFCAGIDINAFLTVHVYAQKPLILARRQPTHTPTAHTQGRDRRLDHCLELANHHYANKKGPMALSPYSIQIYGSGGRI